MELAWALHPELRGVAIEAAEAESGVKWHLPLTLDAVVLRRMSDATLPDARVVKLLQQRGAARLEAIHRIGSVLAEAIWHIGSRSRKASADSPRDARDAEKGALPDAINAKINVLA
jgi:hypothetical protein